MNTPETATSVRVKAMEAELAHRRLTGHPLRQAEVIAAHYLAHAMIAKDILDMLKLRSAIPNGPGYSTEDVDWCIFKELDIIKENHRKDLGIELMWPDDEVRPQETQRNLTQEEHDWMIAQAQQFKAVKP